MKKIAIVLTMATVALMAAAQMANPVTFTSQLKTTNGSSEGEIVFTGKIDKGWHVYSTNLGDCLEILSILKHVPHQTSDSKPWQISTG